MRAEVLYLCDMVEAIDSIDSFIHEVSWEEFKENEILKNAVLLKLLIIGEAASRLSSEFKDIYPNIPWKDIVGFRNIAIHSYFSVKWEIVWETATEDIAELQNSIMHILRNEYSDTYDKFFSGR